MSRESRRAKRFIVVDLNLYYQEAADHPIGRIVNLSEGGLLAFCHQEMSKEIIQKLRVQFSKKDGIPVNFDFQARVIWCKQNPLDTKMYSVGIEFMQNPDLQMQFVQQMIKLYGKLSSTL